MQNLKIQVASGSDERYYMGLLMTLSSILISCKNKAQVEFHILDGGIKEHSWEQLKKIVHKISPETKINRYKPDLSIFSHFPAFFFDAPMNYARLLLPELLKDYDKVIYTDSDILHLKDISLLWQHNLRDNVVAACVEMVTPTLGSEYFDLAKLQLDGEKSYFNNGLMVMNLKKWRKHHIAEDIMQFLASNPKDCYFHEQSAMNALLNDKVCFLDQSWNIQSHRSIFRSEEHLDAFRNGELNFHFVTKEKPWLTKGLELPHQMASLLYTELGINIFSDASNITGGSKSVRSETLNAKVLLHKFTSALYGVMGKTDKEQFHKRVAQYWRQQVLINKSYYKLNSKVTEILSAWQIQINESQN